MAFSLGPHPFCVFSIQFSFGLFLGWFPCQYKWSSLCQSETLFQPAVWRKVTLLITFLVAHIDPRMATASWMTHSAALMLLLVLRCQGFAVPSPEDLHITDPGHLGHMVITWSPPVNMTMNMMGCSLKYQLEYFNTYTNSWSSARTMKTTYSAQFDLMKDIRVRVYTLLSGSCTNNKVIMSSGYTEVIQKPPNTGVLDAEILDFNCVFQNMEYMECKWRKNANTPTKSQHNLFFWHEELEQAEECPEYILSRGIRRGCNFTGKSFPYFTDINFCVNGSSPQGPLKQTFISLQIQNQVKPAPAEKVQLLTGPDFQLQLLWKSPAGTIPKHCLEWEVKHSKRTWDGEISPNLLNLRQTSLSLHFSHQDKQNCFRVRSKLNRYCADRGFWSNWSQKTCHPATALGHGNAEESSSAQTSWTWKRRLIRWAYHIILLEKVRMLVFAVAWSHTFVL